MSSYKRSPEVRAKMSEARKRAWADPEVRAKMSEGIKRALADPEVRAKMSEGIKRALADPEVQAKMSEARKRALADPEVRAKMSEARKRAWAAANPDLAQLSPDQLKIYRMLRGKKCTHAEALREACREKKGRYNDSHT